MLGTDANAVSVLIMKMSAGPPEPARSVVTVVTTHPYIIMVKIHVLTHLNTICPLMLHKPGNANMYQHMHNIMTGPKHLIPHLPRISLHTLDVTHVHTHIGRNDHNGHQVHQLTQDLHVGSHKHDYLLSQNTLRQKQNNQLNQYTQHIQLIHTQLTHIIHNLTHHRRHNIICHRQSTQRVTLQFYYQLSH